ncbi:hypothetical protein ACIPC1_09030 [Streptomyces sp. NPDC087263]|uniref:hypothetical protein n=1 Tax=Streptomyces sp. NPDC087263 TaxID=3365773 RepID=UPI0037FD0FDF
MPGAARSSRAAAESVSGVRLTQGYVGGQGGLFQYREDHLRGPPGPLVGGRDAQRRGGGNQATLGAREVDRVAPGRPGTLADGRTRWTRSGPSGPSGASGASGAPGVTGVTGVTGVADTDEATEQLTTEREDPVNNGSDLLEAGAAVGGSGPLHAGGPAPG